MQFKLGLDMVAMMGAQCFENVLANLNGDDDEIVTRSGLPEDDDLEADSDPYDPSKPEYISPATQEEVDRTNAVLLAKQIAKLEAYATRRRAESRVARHYDTVLSSWRGGEAAAGGKPRSPLSGRRVQSEPSLVQLEETSVRSRCHAASDGFAAMLEECSPTSCAEEMPGFALDEDDSPVVSAVRGCSTPTIPSIAQLNRNIHRVELGESSAPQCLCDGTTLQQAAKIPTVLLVATATVPVEISML